MNKFAIFAVANFLTIFMLSWVGIVPSWIIIIPIVQSIPLFAWAYDYEEK
jgi:hypothetical protein